MKRYLLICLLFLISQIAFSQTATAQECADALTPQLQVGGLGVVSFAGGQPLPLLDAPASGGQVVAHLAAGTEFAVLEGPQCAEGLYWWRIEASEAGSSGWIAESEGEAYRVQPVARRAEPQTLLPDGAVLVARLESGALSLLDSDLNILEELPPTEEEYISLSQRHVYIYAPTAAADSVLVFDAQAQRTTFAIPQVEGELVGFAVKPDDSAIAWLYDQTAVPPTYEGCEEAEGCVGRLYQLVVTDNRGQEGRVLWNGQVGEPYPTVALSGWLGDEVVLRYMPWRMAGFFIDPHGGSPFSVNAASGAVTQWVDPESYRSYATIISPEGHYMAHATSSDWVITIATLDGKPVYVETDDGSALSSYFRFSPDSRYVAYETLYFDSGRITGNFLDLLDIEQGAKRKLVALPNEMVLGALTWLTPSVIAFSVDNQSYIMDIDSAAWGRLAASDGAQAIATVYGLIRAA